jgi:hypothetical protein
MRATQAPLGPAVATLSGAAEVEDISWKARQNLTQCVSHRNNSCGRRNTVISMKWCNRTCSMVTGEFGQFEWI